ncbi:hypothetical protein PIROE2DRAFT_64322 [Piromyces sp. E2]|nr:hypothetical protein PIROE2DRAFT_64322 [Piromyces sp. E2]|eukprot:OUM58561.1 hypothetical protein PIROE2DRAFT_64322 [Piromyces sp. E2]
MIIEHFGGKVEVFNIEEIEKILLIRYGNNVNEFWLTIDKKIPCLAILVNNDKATITYFIKEGHPGFQSLNKNTNNDNNKYSVFYTNTPTEEIEIDNNNVISIDLVNDVVKEFYNTHQKPTCIEWMEL